MNNTVDEIDTPEEERACQCEETISTGEEGAAPPRRLTLRKGEKLRHRSLTDPLFRKGYTLYDFPLRVTWRALSDEELTDSFRDAVPERIDSLQMFISVPKKKRRHAVDRVLMRRRIREAYRLNRLPLKDAIENNPRIRTLSMAIIYLSDRNLPYEKVEEKLKSILSRLQQKVETARKSGGGKGGAKNNMNRKQTADGMDS